MSPNPTLSIIAVVLVGVLLGIGVLRTSVLIYIPRSIRTLPRRVVRLLIRDELRQQAVHYLPFLAPEEYSQYDAIELTPELIEELNAQRPDVREVRVMPHKDGPSLARSDDLLTSIHPLAVGDSMRDPPEHAFEMYCKNGRVGFKFVLDKKDYRDRLSHQLDTFYPDSHFETSEATQPDLLPLHEGWYAAATTLRLKLRGRKKRHYPIKHIDIEGFDSDPYGSITGELVGNKEDETVTNVAAQVVFRPAPKNWDEGPGRMPSIHQIADDIEESKSEPPPTEVATAMLSGGGWDLSDITEDDSEQNQSNSVERKAAEAVRKQAGQKAFDVNIRIIAVGEKKHDAIVRVSETADMFENYYDSNTKQGFDPVPLTGRDLRRELKLAFGRNYVDRKTRMGVRTASSIIHIPNDASNASGVEWTYTSNAGDVPAGASRFSEWMAPEIGWERTDRSAKLPPDDWHYDIEQEQPSSEELEAARRKADS